MAIRMRTRTSLAQFESLRILLVPLVLCVTAGVARAGDDPEPPTPKGEIAEAFAKLRSKDVNERDLARRTLFEKVGPQHLDEVIWQARRGGAAARETAYDLIWRSNLNK